MEELVRHYGSAVLYGLIFVCIALLIAWLCTAGENGFIAQQFQAALQSFFTKMNAVS